MNKNIKQQVESRLDHYQDMLLATIDDTIRNKYHIRISTLQYVLSLFEGGEKSDGIISPIMQESNSERLLMAFQQWQLDNPNDVQYNSHKECAKTFLAINGA